ncbi:MAG: hypothetical protein ACI9NC_005753, partial [Verrucomicrobiales bacterium]
ERNFDFEIEARRTMGLSVDNYYNLLVILAITRVSFQLK